MGPRFEKSGAAQVIVVGEASERKTPRPAERSFGSMLGGVANVALAGVEIGATVVGGPLTGAAVRGARVGLDVATGGAVGGGATGLGTGAAADEASTMNEVRAMQEQAQEFNLQYLALQEEVQQENRRFSTVSNVLKAKHETAKAAVSNIRA